jgi:hypothetical protein
MTQVIAMWSGPRNLSTAMMRSFGSREDCSVMDEPFFASFLAVSGKEHPGREETLAQHETDPEKVAELCENPKTDRRYAFQKHMPHHMLKGFPIGWAKKAKHFFLIREPARVIASYLKGRDEFNVEDLGFAPQRRLFKQLYDMTGTPPPVIDSFDVLRSPEKSLRTLCDSIDIPFDRAMLSWEKGTRPEDGAWAPYWYKSVQDSTGFGPPPEIMPTVPHYHDVLLKMCQQDFSSLAQYKLFINHDT